MENKFQVGDPVSVNFEIGLGHSIRVETLEGTVAHVLPNGMLGILVEEDYIVRHQDDLSQAYP